MREHWTIPTWNLWSSRASKSETKMYTRKFMIPYFGVIDIKLYLEWYRSFWSHIQTRCCDVENISTSWGNVVGCSAQRCLVIKYCLWKRMTLFCGFSQFNKITFNKIFRRLTVYLVWESKAGKLPIDSEKIKAVWRFCIYENDWTHSPVRNCAALFEFTKKCWISPPLREPVAGSCSGGFFSGKAWKFRVGNGIFGGPHNKICLYCAE